MFRLKSLSRQQQLIYRKSRKGLCTSTRGEKLAVGWADEDGDPKARQARWEEHAGRIRTGSQPSMLSILESRGLVKDVAGSVFR